MPEVTPWCAAQDIRAGTRWGVEIERALRNSSFGIICLTPESLDRPWIHFEAGAIALTMEQSRIVPYLFELEPSDLKGGPLELYQGQPADETGSLNLIQSIYETSRDRGSCSLSWAEIEIDFESKWPFLESALGRIRESGTLTELLSPRDRAMEAIAEDAQIILMCR